jgi:hypothetical protein
LSTHDYSLLINQNLYQVMILVEKNLCSINKFNPTNPDYATGITTIIACHFPDQAGASVATNRAAPCYPSSCMKLQIKF